VRLNIYPDGGVARFRVHGVVKPDPAKLRSGELVDLAAAENGAIVITTNDAFFGPKDNLILPGRATTMGEGWETRRKRVPGFDWIVVKLAVPGTVHKLEVDTNHFKGNYPDMCSLEGCFLKEDLLDFANAKEISWQEILPRTKLQAHHRHFYESELRAPGPFTHVRLNIFPDGGISRLRVHGRPA
jgi:allantoicase